MHPRLPLLALTIALTPTLVLADPVEPRTQQDVQSVIEMPQHPTCSDGSAFGVRLAQPVEASTVGVVEKGVKWVGSTTVTEFRPPEPSPPFTRFFYLETGISHLAVWSLAAAFYESESLAFEAAERLASWYAAALKTPIADPLIPIKGQYRIRRNGFTLMILASGKAVRVSCEHFGTSNTAIQESMELDRRRKSKVGGPT